MQCCACSKWVHLRCSTFLIPIQSSWQLSLLELSPLPNHCDSLFGLLRHVYLHCAIWPPLLTLLSRPTLVSKLLIPPSAHSISSPSAPPPSSLAPGFSSAPPASTPPLTLSGFFNGMLEVFEPGALNYFTFFRPILSTFSAFRNPIFTPFSGFVGSLLCALIAPTPGLAFSPPIPRTLAATLSFSSGRAYLFLNFLRLILTLTM